MVTGCHKFPGAQRGYALELSDAGIRLDGQIETKTVWILTETGLVRLAFERIVRPGAIEPQRMPARPPRL